MGEGVENMKRVELLAKWKIMLKEGSRRYDKVFKESVEMLNFHHQE